MNTPISDSLPRINLCSDPLNCGFTMTFSNCVTVSIRFGTGNYSDGKTTAEAAAWHSITHDWLRVPGFGKYDQVIGHLSTDDIAKFIRNASRMKYGWRG